MNNSTTNRNRNDDGKYAKWHVCDFTGCKNILGDLDDGAWAFSNKGEMYCLNHDANEYENDENYVELTSDGQPIDYAQAK